MTDCVKAILRAKDHYEVLSVSENCTQDDIKRSYRKRAAIVHPDRNGHPKATEAFQKLADAYNTLSDNNKRAQYDQSRQMNKNFESFTGNGGGSPSFRTYTQGPCGFTFTTYSGDYYYNDDILRAFFGHPGHVFTNAHYHRRAYREQKRRERQVSSNTFQGLTSILLLIPILAFFLLSLVPKQSNKSINDELKGVIKFANSAVDDYSRIPSDHVSFRSIKYGVIFGIPKKYLLSHQNYYWSNDVYYLELRKAADEIYIEKLTNLCNNAKTRWSKSCRELKSRASA